MHKVARIVFVFGWLLAVALPAAVMATDDISVLMPQPPPARSVTGQTRPKPHLPHRLRLSAGKRRLLLAKRRRKKGPLGRVEDSMTGVRPIAGAARPALAARVTLRPISLPSRGRPLPSASEPGRNTSAILCRKLTSALPISAAPGLPAAPETGGSTPLFSRPLLRNMADTTGPHLSVMCGSSLPPVMPPTAPSRRSASR